MQVKKIYPIIERELRAEKSNSITDFMEDKLIISTHTFFHILSTKDILYIEADGNYSKIHVSDGRIITASKTLKEFETFLLKHTFCRVHAGFLINLQKLTGIRKNGSLTMIMENNVEIPLSNSYKKEIYSKLQAFKI